MIKEEEKKEVIEVPVGGYFETWRATEANQLIMSGEYYEKQVCANGKYILVRRK